MSEPLKQVSKEEEVIQQQRPIEAPGEQHLACVLLLDTSGSMGPGPNDKPGEAPIDLLNDALSRFKYETTKDPVTARRVDIAIVEFNSEVRVLQPFLPIGKMETVTLKATGETRMGQGIMKALDLVEEKNRQYAKLGVPCFQPWVVMITDGAPTDDITEAAKRIRAREEKGAKGKLKFWTLGVPGYNLNTVCELSKKKRIMELKGKSFEGFFSWLAESMAIISVSDVNAQVQLPPIDATSVKVVSKEDIPKAWQEDD